MRCDVVEIKFLIKAIIYSRYALENFKPKQHILIMLNKDNLLYLVKSDSLREK